MIPRDVLDEKQVQQVLRYWLGTIRAEEALASRPRARPPARGGAGRVQVKRPRPGQTYFKLRPAAEVQALLLGEVKAIELDLDVERAAFTEHWINETYRQYRRSEERPLRWLLGFPVLRMVRTDELAPLLRMRVQLSWHDDEGKVWKPPGKKTRDAKGPALEGPTRLRVTLPDEDEEDLLPYAVDRQLLSRTLGVPDELADDAFEAMRGAGPSKSKMLEVLCALLDGQQGPADFGRLYAGCRASVAGPVQAFNVALVYDGSRVQATWHLQRDLLNLLRRPPGRGAWTRRSAVWSYLSGERAEGGRSPMLGRIGEAPTEAQRAAGEGLFGARLTAVQGPPGTGKTALVVHLAASVLVRRAAELAAGGAMGTQRLLITSTNNRAVDNALERLGQVEPPLALRVGNQEITSTVAVEQLGRTLAWLRGSASLDAEQNYKAALEAFDEVFEALDALAGPWRQRQVDAARLEVVERTLQDLAEVEDPGSTVGVTQILQSLARAQRTLDQMLGWLEGEDLAKAQAAWAKRRPRMRKALGLLRARGERLKLEMPLPEAGVEAWLEATESTLEDVEDLQDRLGGALRAGQRVRRREALEQERGELRARMGGAPVEAPDAAKVAELQGALTERAVTLRRCWAVRDRDGLIAALEKGLREIGDRRSLRRLAEKDAAAARRLDSLFPVLGCTLLSLGNALPSEPHSVEWAVVDEAGQCHPAYALAALMRAKHSLVLGDVNQLEPVIRLRHDDERRARRLNRISLDDETLKPFRVVTGSAVSAQSLADASVRERLVLRDHFRCQPPIIRLSDALCGYGLQVHTPPRSRQAEAPWLREAVMCLPTRGQQQRARGSWYNPAEVEAVMMLLHRLARSRVPPEDIALITPYVGQLEALRRGMAQARIPPGAVSTGTVHRFQGGERSVVIFSTVITRPRSLAFLDGRVNLVNVAVTRAREHLLVVGHPEVLSSGRYTRVLVEGVTTLDSL